MTDATLAEIESDLERATDLERDAALALLGNARRRLDELADEPAVDDRRREELTRRVEQRLREVRNRDAYGKKRLGAAMNPEDDDAP